MIKVEQNRKQDCKRNSDENVRNSNIPEMNKPSSISRREECFTRGQSIQGNFSHLADMDESSEENNCKWCTVVFDEYSNIVLKKWTGADDTTEVADNENEEGYHDGEIERFFRSLPREDLDTFLKVDECYVEPKYIAREASNVF